MLRIFKLGGSVLPDTEKLREMARLIYSLDGEKMVVISAIGDTTARMIREYEKVGGREEGLEEYVVIGEIQAAKLFSAALKGLGASVLCLTPEHRLWPLYITKKGKAVLKREKTNQALVFQLFKDSRQKEKLKSIQKLLKKGKIVVMPGFVAKDVRGHLTTLGRGGSDISAALIGDLLNADEIFFIKDVEGVYTGDPKLLSTRRKISIISTSQLERLIGGGTSLLHPDVLSVTTSRRSMHLISPQHLSPGQPPPAETGTMIHPSRREPIEVTPLLTQILLVGRRLSEHARELAEILQPLEEQKISPISVHTEADFCSIYIRDEQASEVYVEVGKVAYQSWLITSTTMKKGLRGIRVHHPPMSRYAEHIVSLLRRMLRQGIHIWELRLGATDMDIYLEDEQAEKAKQLVIRWKNEIA